MNVLLVALITSTVLCRRQWLNWRSN